MTYREMIATEEPAASLLKILAVRSHFNSIENMLISIFAQHAIRQRGDYKDGKYDRVYKDVFDAIRELRKKIFQIEKECHRDREEEDPGCSCWTDEDCRDPKYYCDPATYTCVLIDEDQGRKQRAASKSRRKSEGA